MIKNRNKLYAELAKHEERSVKEVIEEYERVSTEQLNNKIKDYEMCDWLIDVYSKDREDKNEQTEITEDNNV